MNILLFGATGMVGDGVLRWLIASPKVSRVVAVSRACSSLESRACGLLFHCGPGCLNVFVSRVVQTGLPEFGTLLAHI
jgi:hypothetical protein